MIRAKAAAALAAGMIAVSPIHAEYCIDWRPWLQKYAGQSGHCWPTESECNAYYFSRCMNSNYKHDCAGPCYFKPGMYPKTGAAKSPKSDDGAAAAAKKAAALKQQQQQDALKKAFQQQQFNAEKEGLLGSMKGVPPSFPSNQIVLKPVPPARSQLDCIANNEANRSWELRAPNCTPVLPSVPEPGKPVEAVGTTTYDPQMLGKFIETLHQRVSTARESLSKQDAAIRAMEKEISQKEMQAPDTKLPKGESDALKRAREALAKAKADRERTAQELARLEQQEKEAKNSLEGGPR
ncbi:MAG: hypothetical protein AB1763_08260 [Campylobacterota bacterium]